MKNGNPNVSTAKWRLIPLVHICHGKTLSTLRWHCTYSSPLVNPSISNRVHFCFFGRVLAPVNATSSESHRKHPPNASVCNARTLWSRVASLSANHPNYNHSSIDKIPHPKFGVSSKLAALFSAFLAVRVQWFPTLRLLSYWSMAFIFYPSSSCKIPNGFYKRQHPIPIPIPLWRWEVVPQSY